MQQVAEVGEQLDQCHRQVGDRRIGHRIGELQPVHQHRPQRGVVPGQHVVIRWGEPCGRRDDVDAVAGIAALRPQPHRQERPQRIGRQVGRVQSQVVDTAPGPHLVQGQGEVAGHGRAIRRGARRDGSDRGDRRAGHPWRGP